MPSPARLQAYQQILERPAVGTPPLESLEEIRMLSNLETSEEKLLQIVLFGQPELDHRRVLHPRVADREGFVGAGRPGRCMVRVRPGAEQRFRKRWRRHRSQVPARAAREDRQPPTRDHWTRA